MSAWHVFRRNTNFISHATIFKRLYHKIQPLSDHVSEVEIKVPWGKVAGRLWGSPDKQPILALHGWQDNAASFDILAPLLFKHTPVLAIDWPGHGRSSWLPEGIIYTELSYLTTIQRVKKYFGWEKVKILAHSMGAQISFFYASTFPDEIKFVIALDALTVIPIDTKTKRGYLGEAINKLLKVEERNTPIPTHSHEQVIERWIKATDGSIDENACRTLMTRGTRQHKDGKLSFSRDPNVKIGLYTMFASKTECQKMTQLITCPYLYLKGEQSVFMKNSEWEEEIIRNMKQTCPDFRCLTLPGAHHFHMTHPQTVVEPITSFLEKYDH